MRAASRGSAACTAAATRVARSASSQARAAARRLSGGSGARRPAGRGREPLRRGTGCPSRPRRRAAGSRAGRSAPRAASSPLFCRRRVPGRRRAAGHACCSGEAGELDQAGTGQLPQHPARLPWPVPAIAASAHASRSVPGCSAARAKPRAVARVQVPDRPGEDLADRGPAVPARLQQVQAALPLLQLAGQHGQRDAGAGGGELGGYPQRQRQPAAAGRPAAPPRRGRRRPARRSARSAARSASSSGSRSSSPVPRRPWRPARPGHPGWSPAPRRMGLPGSSGRTCSAPAALSSTISIARSASRLR